MIDFLPSIEAKRFGLEPVYGQPQPDYGPPIPAEYGPPSAQKLITKNIYLHVPPQEDDEYRPAQVFEKPIPKKHYKIVFIKGMPYFITDGVCPTSFYTIENHRLSPFLLCVCVCVSLYLAPTAPTPTAPVIPEQSQDEHKTLVYVLVKKPEPQPLIEIPKIKPTEPSKPEVYFIKYKADENASPEFGPSKPVYGPPA